MSDLERRSGRPWRVLAALAATLLGAVITVSASSPSFATTDGSYASHLDLPYVAPGNGQQTLDLYVPRSAQRPMPVVVYIHGGGWLAGDKSELLQLAGWQALIARGLAVASINYTLSGTGTFPQQIYDVKAAVRYLRANAGRFGLSNAVGLWGGSAGGQLAALAGATCDVRPLEGRQGVLGRSSCVQAVVDLSGPTDLLEQDNHLLNDASLRHEPAGSPDSLYLGCAAGLRACPASTVERANPITYLTTSSDLPPFLVAHGDADPLVPYWESKILFDALVGVCANVTFYTLHDQGHMFPFTGALDPPYPAQTVQRSRNCQPTSTTDGPPLSWSVIAAFFRSSLR